jgi:hypothetical protein
VGSVPRSFGVSTADATNVRLVFERSSLTLHFVDWRECPRELRFEDVLAFRWVVAGEARPWRDDATSEVVDSEWLARSAAEQAVAVDRYAHHQLGFNAVGGMVLEVLARRIPPRAEGV